MNEWDTTRDSDSNDRELHRTQSLSKDLTNIALDIHQKLYYCIFSRLRFNLPSTHPAHRTAPMPVSDYIRSLSFVREPRDLSPHEFHSVIELILILWSIPPNVFSIRCFSNNFVNFDYSFILIALFTWLQSKLKLNNKNVLIEIN